MSQIIVMKDNYNKAYNQLKAFQNSYATKINEIMSIFEKNENWSGKDRKTFDTKMKEHNVAFKEYEKRIVELIAYMDAVKREYQEFENSISDASKGIYNEHNYGSIIDYSVNYDSLLVKDYQPQDIN